MVGLTLIDNVIPIHSNQHQTAPNFVQSKNITLISKPNYKKHVSHTFYARRVQKSMNYVKIDNLVGFNLKSDTFYKYL